jgi:S-DNA-T family DNA segregation ATPase FtsK/SpoIIIE
MGLSKCGLTTAVSTLARAVMRRYTPAQAQLYVVDPNNQQLQVVEGAHLGRYVYEQEPAREMARELAALLETRRPKGTLSQAELAQRRKSWTGPEIFVFVDNEEAVSDWTITNVFDEERAGHPLRPLVQLAAQGADIGLHLIVARRLDNWARAANSLMVGPLAALKVPGIVMNADPTEGIVMGIKGAVQPPGRGTYIDGMQGLTAPVQIAVSEPDDAPPIPVDDGEAGGRHHTGDSGEGSMRRRRAGGWLMRSRRPGASWGCPRRTWPGSPGWRVPRCRG